MKKKKTVLLITVILFCLTVLQSCATVRNPENESAPEGVNDTTLRYISFEEAHNKFNPLLDSGSENDYAEAIQIETEKIATSVETVYQDIINLLESSYSFYVSQASPEMSLTEYRERFVEPFKAYYDSRTADAEKANDAYIALGSVISYPAASGARTALLWEYVYYKNLFVELSEIKDSIKVG